MKNYHIPLTFLLAVLLFSCKKGGLEREANLEKLNRNWTSVSIIDPATGTDYQSAKSWISLNLVFSRNNKSQRLVPEGSFTLTDRTRFGLDGELLLKSNCLYLTKQNFTDIEVDPARKFGETTTFVFQPIDEKGNLLEGVLQYELDGHLITRKIIFRQ